MIGGDLIHKVRGAISRAKYDDAVVVVQERPTVGAEALYRSVEGVFYDSHHNMIVVQIGSERVSRKAVSEGWRPEA